LLYIGVGVVHTGVVHKVLYTGVVKVFSTADGSIVSQYTGHTGPVYDAQFDHRCVVL